MTVWIIRDHIKGCFKRVTKHEGSQLGDDDDDEVAGGLLKSEERNQGTGGVGGGVWGGVG